jgi:hypothetical protein
MQAKLFRLCKIITPVVWALLIIALLAVPVLAIDNPDSMSINAVYVYRHCQEDDDQLYIIDYTITYSSNPDENVTEAFIVRLMSGAVELGSTAPYAYYDDGYGRGIASIYFTSAEAPAWNGAYTMRLAGNPTLDWSGDPPFTSVGSFDLWSSSTSQGATEAELGARILYYADVLELAWSVDLIETAGAGSYLTSYGEDYFANSIEDLQAVCPNIFSAGVSQSDWPDVDTTPNTYASTLRGAITGTPLDLSPTAGVLGVDTIWLTTAIFAGIMAISAYGIARVIGSVKPALFIMASLVPIGIMIGWLDLLVGILMGFAAIVTIAYVFFLQKSPA